MSGDLLREARRRAGLSQPDLARRAGKPISSIGRWERGEVRPSLETLRALVRACDLEMTIHLANADTEDHDLSLIDRALARTPAARIAESVDAAAAISALFGPKGQAPG
ncbi:MAG: helix-turn-helix domain-containing protein [Candidatus Limnocylindria bacterium]